MAEATLARSGPLAGHRSVVVSGLAPAIRFSFRGGEVALTRLGAVFGVTPETQACRAALAGDRAALWLGPDEWLLLAPDDDAAVLARSIAETLGDEPHSLVDVSHRNTGFAIEGDGVESLLNEGCPLDLSESAFPAGMCTRTVMAKAEIILWRQAPMQFHLECWRSYMPYVRLFLTQAAENLD